MIGSRYVTGRPSTAVLCSTDDDAVNRAEDALAKNDQEGAEEALAGSLISVAPRTTILVLNYDMFRGVLDMRIYSGANAGTRAYCVVGNDNNGFIAKKLKDTDASN
jgi:hypothetical protein